MKFILALLVAACLPVAAEAQQTAEKRGIIESLTQESDSTVSVVLSPSLLKELVPETGGEEQEPQEAFDADEEQDDERPAKKVVLRTNGYRIQIFSDGRHQSTLRDRARARAKKIISKFPQYNRQVYSFSKAPNYFTRIGNFATKEEADKALVQLRRAFPEFAGEIRVVPSEVIISK